MGQRLNIEIYNGETPLANCYYHWSAYTDSALELTKEIIDGYYDSDKDANVKLAVRLFEQTGAGVNEAERANIKKHMRRFVGVKFKDAVSRSDGLISVTEEGMEDTRYYEEGRVVIDLDDKTFDFGILAGYTVDEYEDEYDELASDLPECPYNLSAVEFNEIDALIQFVSDNPDGFTDGEHVFQWVS